MKKTDNFFLIHNFNTVPEDLLAYCKGEMDWEAVISATKADWAAEKAK